MGVTDPSGTYGFSYDNMGRLTGITVQYSFLSGTTFTNAYSYDAASNRKGYTAPDGSTNTYSYDTLNRLTTLINSATGSFGFSYDQLSRRTQLTRPNGITTNYTYDNLSRLLSILHQSGSSTIDGAAYTLDSAGNRTAKTDEMANVTTNYGYDNLYELLSATQGGTTTESYSYDPVGNRTASLNIPSYTTNSSNEMTANSNASFTYDNNGNTHTKTDSSGTTTYGWDYENRLTTVTLPGSAGTVSFKYDPFGRRIEKTSPTATSIFAYDGDNLAETTNSSGSEVASYTQGDSIDEPLAMLRGTTKSFYEADGLGSITSMSDSGGTLVETYTYDSFGNTTNSSGSLTNLFHYTGRELDTEANLYFNRARYLDPVTGRFLSEDPFKFVTGPDFYFGHEVSEIEGRLFRLHYYDPMLQEFISTDPAAAIGGYNFYSYARLNPSNLTDPFGLWTIQIGGTIGVNIPIWGPVGIAGSAFGGLAYDGHHWALYGGVGGGAGVGAGVSGGLTIGGSNARNVCALGGPFIAVGGSGGWGWGGGLEGFAGKDSSGNKVLGGDLMIGGAAGGSGSLQGTYTWVHPPGGSCKCQ